MALGLKVKMSRDFLLNVCEQKKLGLFHCFFFIFLFHRKETVVCALFSVDCPVTKVASTLPSISIKIFLFLICF